MIRAPGAAAEAGAQLAAGLGAGCSVDTTSPTPGSGPPAGTISLALDGPGELGDEGYELTSSAAGVLLRAHQPAGLLHGVQTLRQLVVPAPEAAGEIAGVTIRDLPRYAWRGMMLDVARHFFAVDDVLRLIDLLTFYKLNVLHLHLSDDQGWRLAISSRPALAEAGGSTQVGDGPGGCYSQADFSRIVAYAAQRHVTVVPEIDMPGHTNAALVAYPALAGEGVEPVPYRGVEVGFSSLVADRPDTYAFVDDVVREIAALVPGGYLHLGGDEALSTSAQDYATFLGRALPIVAAHGLRPVGWQEIARVPLPPGALVQYWDVREPALAAAAVRNGARLILSPADRVYLDMKYDPDWPLGNDWAAHIDVRDAYDWEPDELLDGVSGDAVAGVEAALWTEFVTRREEIEVMTLPRLPAVAEVGWSPRDVRDWSGFRERLAGHATHWDALGLAYYRSAQVGWKPQ